MREKIKDVQRNISNIKIQEAEGGQQTRWYKNKLSISITALDTSLDELLIALEAIIQEIR